MTVNLFITSEKYRVKFLVDSGNISHAAGYNWKAISNRWSDWTLVSTDTVNHYYGTQYLETLNKVELWDKYRLNIQLIVDCLAGV